MESRIGECTFHRSLDSQTLFFRGCALQSLLTGVFGTVVPTVIGPYPGQTGPTGLISYRPTLPKLSGSIGACAKTVFKLLESGSMKFGEASNLTPFYPSFSFIIPGYNESKLTTLHGFIPLSFSKALRPLLQAR